MLEGGAAVPPDRLDFTSLGTVDRWILARLSVAAGEVNAALEAFRFDDAANALYQFFWSDFCDGYVEMVKPVLRGQDAAEPEKEKTRGVLTRVLLDSLALLHPFMPFVSCEIREALNGDGLRLTMAKFPEANPAWIDPLAVEAVEVMRAVTTRIRNLRAENGLAQTEALSVGLELPESPLSRQLQLHVPLLSHLARLKAVEISSKVKIAGGFRDVVAGIGVVVDLPKKEISSEDREKLQRDVERLRGEAAKIRVRLADEGFLSRAPGAVVEKTRQQFEEIEERIRRLSGNLVETPDA
jgi:valyl-tRNA synthetase